MDYLEITVKVLCLLIIICLVIGILVYSKSISVSRR